MVSISMNLLFFRKNATTFRYFRDKVPKLQSRVDTYSDLYHRGFS
jgi:hypothetical protein